MFWFLIAAIFISGMWLLFVLLLTNTESIDISAPPSKVRVIASLTTSPRRLMKMRDTLLSIVNQSTPPDLVVLNLPLVFERTREEYTIPDWLTKDKFPTVVVNRVEMDLGPITKLLPTLEVVNHCVDYIWVVDDDQLYNSQQLEYMLDCATTKEGVLCLSGLQRRMLDGVATFREMDLQEARVDVFEAYAGVLLPREAIGLPTFKPYVMKAIQDPDCCFSDDLITSTYLERRGVLVQKIGSSAVSIDEHWRSRRVLQYGRQADALSRQQVSTVDRYSKAYPKLLAMM